LKKTAFAQPLPKRFAEGGKESGRADSRHSNFCRY
jgi:hypothetical protein